MRCPLHVSVDMVAVSEPRERPAGTTIDLHPARIALRCPVEGCRRWAVEYNAKPPEEGTRMWNAVGLKGHRDLDWLEVE